MVNTVKILFVINVSEPFIANLEDYLSGFFSSILLTLDYPKETELQITFDEILGKGHSGVVYKGVFKSRNVAVKLIRYSPQGKEGYEEEAKILLKSDGHENIVKCFNYWSPRSIVLIALELCNCTVEQWIKEKHKVDLSADPIDVLCQATKGIEFLHSNDIIHFDVSPQNILLLKISKDIIRVKIADFGNSRQLPLDIGKLTLNDWLETDTCVSPEVLNLKTAGRRSRQTNVNKIHHFNIVL